MKAGGARLENGHQPRTKPGSGWSRGRACSTLCWREQVGLSSLRQLGPVNLPSAFPDMSTCGRIPHIGLSPTVTYFSRRDHASRQRWLRKKASAALLRVHWMMQAEDIPIRSVSRKRAESGDVVDGTSGPWVALPNAMRRPSELRDTWRGRPSARDGESESYYRPAVDRRERPFAPISGQYSFRRRCFMPISTLTREFCFFFF